MGLFELPTLPQFSTLDLSKLKKMFPTQTIYVRGTFLGKLTLYSARIKRISGSKLRAK